MKARYGSSEAASVNTPGISTIGCAKIGLVFPANGCSFSQIVSVVSHEM